MKEQPRGMVEPYIVYTKPYSDMNVYELIDEFKDNNEEITNICNKGYIDIKSTLSDLQILINKQNNILKELKDKPFEYENK